MNRLRLLGACSQVSSTRTRTVGSTVNTLAREGVRCASSAGTSSKATKATLTSVTFRGSKPLSNRARTRRSGIPSNTAAQDEGETSMLMLACAGESMNWRVPAKV
jgi:hypothetical protein